MQQSLIYIVYMYIISFMLLFDIKTESQIVIYYYITGKH